MGRSTWVSLEGAQLVLGGLALILALATVGFLLANASLQQTAATGQAKIASAQAAVNVNNSLIRLLAKSATENNDPTLKALLSENGITVSPTASAAPVAPVAK